MDWDNVIFHTLLLGIAITLGWLYGRYTKTHNWPMAKTFKGLCLISSLWIVAVCLLLYFLR